MALLDRLRRRGAPAAEGPDMDRFLAVGLTNPEAEYGGTRHNIGADTVRALAARLGVTLKPHKAQGLIADAFTHAGGVPLTLAVPFGYMNNSGGPVQQMTRFYSIPPERLIVVHDELDLDVGVVRLKQGGGHGGHNGIRDVAQRIGSPDFLRVRIGIGRPPGQMPGARYVLQRFSAKEREEIVDVAVQQAADAILLLATEGLERAQNRVHSPR